MPSYFAASAVAALPWRCPVFAEIDPSLSTLMHHVLGMRWLRRKSGIDVVGHRSSLANLLHRSSFLLMPMVLGDG